MPEIEFSVMSNNPGSVAARFAPLLEAFETQSRIHVNLTIIPWDSSWPQIVKFGLYGKGPDVSEVGTTWVGSLASMGALRPFTSAEVASLGGVEAFFHTSWRVNLLPGDDRPWGIPWLADTLLIYYWKEALRQAGITDIRAAFATPSALQETLAALQKAGYAHPLSMMVHNSNRIMHLAANWIWSAGGDMMTPDGKQAIFADEAAVRGFRSYFGLLPYISPEMLKETSPSGLFQAQKAAIMIDGLHVDVTGRREKPAWREQIGLANLFEQTWMGGMNFIIWKHSRLSDESFKLIRFLTYQAARFPVKLHEVTLYAHREAFALPADGDEVYQQACEYALQHGRSLLPTIQGWGSIEDKLDKAINNVWPELFADPGLDPGVAIRKYIESLASRLNVVLRG